MSEALTPLDRLWQSFRALVVAEIRATVGYPGTYEYSIIRADGSTVDATPTNTTIGLPSINNLPLRTSPIGPLTPSKDRLCHVVFLSGDARAPRVTWVQPGDGPGIVRIGDDVNAGYLVLKSTPPGTIAAYFPGDLVGQLAATAAAAALTPPGTVQPLDQGFTTSGSDKAGCE